MCVDNILGEEGPYVHLLLLPSSRVSATSDLEALDDLIYTCSAVL